METRIVIACLHPDTRRRCTRGSKRENHTEGHALVIERVMMEVNALHHQLKLMQPVADERSNSQRQGAADTRSVTLEARWLCLLRHQKKKLCSFTVQEGDLYGGISWKGEKKGHSTSLRPDIPQGVEPGTTTSGYRPQEATYTEGPG